MPDTLLLVFVHAGPGMERPVLGLTGLDRSILGFRRAGLARVVAVPGAGMDPEAVRACLPAAARDDASVAARLDGESETDLVRRLAGEGSSVVALDSDVVVGPRDAAMIAEGVAAGRTLSVEGGLVLAFPAPAVARLPAGTDLPGAAAALEALGHLETVAAPLLVRRLDGSKASRRDVEERLLRGLRKPVEVDGLVGFYLQRPVTTRVSRLLARTPIRPNHLTMLALASGVSGGALVAFGDPLLTALGGILFFLGSYIDCLDGEIARLKFQFSALGEWLDTIADDSSTLAFLIGMTINLAAHHASPALAAVGITACIAFTLGSAYIYHRLVTVIGSGDLTRFQYPFMSDETDPDAPRGPLDLVKYLVKRDFFSAFFCLCALLGILEAAFALGVAGALGFAVAVAAAAWLQHRPAARAS